MTAAAIVNRALQEIAAQASVIGTVGAFTAPDGTASTASDAANILYTPAVEFLLRSQDWEFALIQTQLIPSGIPPWPQWAYSYYYPLDCLKIRQVHPPTWNTNDPQPVRWSFIPGLVGNPEIERRFILTNQADAGLSYTTSFVTEEMWDSVFAEGVVRLLASEFSMALAGRPDFAAKMLEWSASIAGDGAGRDS